MHHFGRLPIMALLMGGMMVWRITRMRGGLHGGGGARGLRTDQLWIVPAIMAVGVALLLWRSHPSGVTWVWIGLALVIGAAVGWWRGGMVRLSVNPATGQLNQQASPAALFFLIGLFVLRFALRAVMIQEGSREYFLVAIDALAVFTLAMFAVQRLEMYLRARKLMA